MSYKQIVSWHTCGKSNVEEEVLKYTTKGEVTPIKGKYLKNIIELRNHYPYGDKININIYPNDTYYIYFNYHPSGSYKTNFKINNDQLVPTVEKIDGISFQAFFSEIVIFSKSEVLQLKSKK